MDHMSPSLPSVPDEGPTRTYMSPKTIPRKSAPYVLSSEGNANPVPPASDGVAMPVAERSSGRNVAVCMVALQMGYRRRHRATSQGGVGG